MAHITCDAHGRRVQLLADMTDDLKIEVTVLHRSSDKRRSVCTGHNEEVWFGGHPVFVKDVLTKGASSSVVR